jgi:hypothetical protein
MGAVLIGLLALPFFMANINAVQLSLGEQQTAQVAVLLASAAKNYMVASHDTLLAQGSSTFSLSNMQLNGFLPSMVNGCTRFGCQWIVEVHKVNDTQLTALLMSQFSARLPDYVASGVASKVGLNGGFIPSNDSGVFGNACVGANAADASKGNAVGTSWQLSLAQFMAARCGQVAVLINVDSGVSSDEWLHRIRVGNDVSANTMLTPLVLGVTRLAGDACNVSNANLGVADPLGSVARDANGSVLYCDGSHWSNVGGGQWKSPPSTSYADLPLVGNLSGDVRLTADTGRAFSWSGTSWQPLALDQQGDLSIPGSAVSGGKVSLLTPDASKGTSIAAGPGAGGVIFGTLNPNDAATLSVGTEGVRLGAVYATGSACSSNQAGLLANGDTSASGLIVSCQAVDGQNYQWQPLGGRLHWQGLVNVTDGGSVGLGTCPGGGSALTSAFPHSLTFSSPGHAFSFSVTTSGQNTAVYHLFDNGLPDTVDSLSVLIFCAYN